MKTTCTMAQTRKRGTQNGAKANGKKKQKTTIGAKQTRPQIPIDEGFKEGGELRDPRARAFTENILGEVRVHIDADGTSWDASLNLSNVSGNNNKFYMLQLLVDDKSDTYYTHARWGRHVASSEFLLRIHELTRVIEWAKMAKSRLWTSPT